MYKPMNTGPFQEVQADVPGDFRTFKLDACWCGCGCGCGCECVSLVISFAKSQIKTAKFVVLLSPYIGSRARLSIFVEFNMLAGLYTNMAEKAQEEFLIPKNFIEAKELVNKLSIEDLRMFCFQDLQTHFGQKRLSANKLVKSILNLDIPKRADGKLLREMYDTLRNRMRSLESLGLKPDDNPSLSMVLLPIFEIKLPHELKEKWELELTKYETEEEDKEINIKKFFQFLEGHVLSKEAPADVKDATLKYSRRNSRGKRFKNLDDAEKMSAQLLVGATDRDHKRLKCGFCAKSHETSRCPSALIKTPDERWDMLMKHKGAPTCFNSSQPGSISHNSRTCKAP